MSIVYIIVLHSLCCLQIISINLVKHGKLDNLHCLSLSAIITLSLIPVGQLGTTVIRTMPGEKSFIRLYTSLGRQELNSTRDASVVGLVNTLTSAAKMRVRSAAINWAARERERVKCLSW